MAIRLYRFKGWEGRLVGGGVRRRYCDCRMSVSEELGEGTKRRTWWFFGEQGACIIVVYYTNGQSESRRFAFPAPGPLRWWRGGEEAAGCGGAEGRDRSAEEASRCLSYHCGS